MYIVVDTGKKGAMVLFNDKGQPLESLAFQVMGRGIDSFMLEQRLQWWLPNRAYVEEVFSRPCQNSKSTFTQGFVAGQVHSIAQLYVPKVEYIPPQRWTNFTKRLSPRPEQTSKQIAQELTEKFYSMFAAPYKSRRGYKLYHDGIADCLCINMFIQRDYFMDFLV